MKYIIILLFLPVFVFSQNEYMDFRSVTNPLYWKNKKPFADYWQQDVHYNLTAELNDSTDIVSGHEQLIYWNNSPKDIYYVYFNLYSNAQCENSYTADLYKNNNYNLKFGKYRSQNLGTTVENLVVNGQKLQTELDGTVLKVYLPKPLHPGENMTFDMDFKTYFDKEAIRNRMKLFNSFGNKHYDLVHWYPRISVYDRKFGWNTDQHMDHEFYGDFGSFHVEITFPNHYVLDATGRLINEHEVLPSELRQQLDISNFAKKPWNSPPSTIIKRDGTKKTWKFSAVNVHDFALTADPTYRIGEYDWNGVKCVALVQEPHCIGWQTCPQFIAKVLEVNTYNIGPYHYPKMICADANDGMEYPMLTLDGGFDPIYRDLIIHEMTHNWFFGMVGTNENYRAMMDEGFTQFYTADTYQFIDGPNKIEMPEKSKYVKRYTEQNRIIDDQIYNGYMNAMARGDEPTLNTHSDDFNGGIRHGGGYSAVYFKTATMLKNLEYVLGRALFDKAMQNYFAEWKFCHPYPEDFRNSIINYTGVDLNWFFDEWIETSKTIDYKIGRVKKGKSKGEYYITFKRKGSMQMPIDFTVIDRNDSAYNYYIPNTWFEKPVRTNMLPRWIGWGPKLKTTYTAKVKISGKIKNVIIDPSRRLADVDMTNNVKKNKVDFKFDSKVYNPSDWKHYELRVRPSFWYNGYDGIKVGAHMNGDYMKVKHVFDATVWFSTGFGQAYLDSIDSRNNYNMVSFLVNYKTATNRFIKKSNVYATLKSLDGLESALLGFEKKSNNDKSRVYIQYKGMVRDLQRDLVYLINRNEWQIQKFNSYLNVGIDHQYNYKRGYGLINLNARAAAFTQDYDYSAITLTAVNKNDLGKININTRVFAQMGFGNHLPDESMLYVSGANPEELMENKYTRSMGFIPPDWGKYGATTNHFTAGGGLNLRGYSGYLLAQNDANGMTVYNYKGTSGAAFNMEIEFGELFSFMKFKKLEKSVKFQPYLFGDAGFINTNVPGKANVAGDLMVDAGAGAALTIHKFGPLYGIKPLTVRFDMPLFINRLPFAEKDYFQFRWMIGISRAF